VNAQEMDTQTILKLAEQLIDLLESAEKPGSLRKSQKPL
jgi:hypothetical protein